MANPNSNASFGTSGEINAKVYVEHNYQDHFHDPIYRPQEDSSNKRRGPRGGVLVPFPEKLYQMLNQISQDGLEDVVSWQPHGRCFVVHQPERFVEEVMPRYFSQTKLTSFQRQVNLYGFRRLTTGNDRNGYYHELFLRGRPDLLKRMTRVRVKGIGCKLAPSPATEPNFYRLPLCYEDDTFGTSEEQLITASIVSSSGNCSTNPMSSIISIGMPQPRKNAKGAAVGENANAAMFSSYLQKRVKTSEALPCPVQSLPTARPSPDTMGSLLLQFGNNTRDATTAATPVDLTPLPSMSRNYLLEMQDDIIALLSSKPEDTNLSSRDDDTHFSSFFHSSTGSQSILTELGSNFWEL